MKAPRVLIAGSALAQPMGGVLRHAREVLPRAAVSLQRRGGALLFADGRPPAPLALGPPAERVVSDVPAQPALARAALEGPALRALLERERDAGRPCDLLHTGHLPVPANLGLPVVLLLHDLEALDELQGPFDRALKLAALGTAARAAVAVVFVSAALRDEFLRHFDFDPRRTHVARHGADHLPLLPRCADRCGPIACVAHLEPRKNLRILIEALALDRSLPDLELAGADRDGHREELQALAERRGVAGRVRFLGELEDQELARLYARARALALPSLREGFGIPLLEAQRAGVPVAMAGSAVLREAAGPDACPFDPRDALDCARALREACSLPAQAVQRAAARAAAFTWDRAAAELVEAWHAAAGSSA